MSASIDRIKDRIRKLFNLASNDAAAEGEIAAALKAASELMLAHQLSEDDVAAAPEDLRTPEEIAADTKYDTAKSWADSSRVPRWQGTLANAVAEFFGTVRVYHDHPQLRRNAAGFAQNDGQKVCGFVFCGPADDAQLAAELHQEVVLTCATAAKLRFGGKLMKGPGRDYCDGFASGLYSQVADAAKAAREVEEAPKLNGATTGQRCTALTVVRAGDIALAKQQRAKEWLRKEKGIQLGSSSGYGRSVKDDGAYQQGKADGRSQSLTKNRPARIGA